MKMKITGYALRDALAEHQLRADTAAKAFNGTLKAFPEDKKDKPTEVVEQYLKAEHATSKLQVAQMRYNLAVTVDVLGEKMTLAEVIKRIGGPARVAKMWRSVGAPTERSGYSDDVRDPNQVRAVATISAAEASKLASVATKKASAFRQAIAVGNAREVELEDLDPGLFE